MDTVLALESVSVAGRHFMPDLAEVILEQISPGIIAFDRQLRLLACNARARALLDVGPASIGAELAHVLPDCALAEAKRALSSSEMEVSAKLVFPNGRVARWRSRRLPLGRWLASIEEVRDADRVGGERDAALDLLTGLGSRAGFSEKGAELVRPGMALIMLDLDRFKQVNDSLGHPAGDTVLRLVGQRILSSLRAEDHAFRLGGDEFAIVLPHGGDAQGLAERLVELLSRSYLVSGQVATIGASAGIAYAPSDSAIGKEGLEPLVQCADLALYAAKVGGKGIVRPFQPEMAQAAQARHDMEQDLRAALARNQFELFYQPQADLETRNLVGFEALLRWRHHERGLIPPDSFIPLAEQTRLIVPIGEWALRSACQEAQSWPVPLPVAVNVSALQLVDTARFCRAVDRALSSSGLDPARLELEITESMLVGDSQAALKALSALQATGVRVAMDDFGTGYSSLSQLRSFPFDKLKIDRSFVRDLGGSAEASAVVRAIAALGKSLGMRTIAEGVETCEQAETVHAEGCTEMQGYLLSRPVPATEIPALFLQLVQTDERQT